MPTQSWGRIKGQERDSKILHWRKDAFTIGKWQGPLLPFGFGRSYGDSCLVKNGTIIHTRQLNKFRHFDHETGRLSCEAGLSIEDLLRFSIARGWFIPVTPGTKHVTLGGAIANDVHGKNHLRRGSIGCHILELELMRSNGEHLQCSRAQEEGLFRATIGGLGLTGIILSCTIQLIPIESVWIDTETIKTTSIDEFFEIDDTSASDYEYSAAWIDCMATGIHEGRGLYMRGNHAKGHDIRQDYQPPSGPLFTVPFDAPGISLNKLTLKAFNKAFYNKQISKLKMERLSFDRFFYQLDAIGDWNRLYGKKGLLQYQCVVPLHKIEPLKKIFGIVAKSRHASYLAVLKRFGSIRSPGMLSFPIEGYTLSLDFRNAGPAQNELFSELDKIVSQAGGRLYPAKDSRMSALTFQTSYPDWTEFERFVDPLFRSMFWERVSTRG